ncbi:MULTISPECIES: urease accessory protein UreD [unclassified Roseovarius]|uniref:urease accessory protein UreD n=1 Tax=unclassified Roseovarius TaxID=2614913 RepID=UPI00273EC1B5|nr:urease accessory protein UreD [Roseovarius sp. MMSF_3350]
MHLVQNFEASADAPRLPRAIGQLRVSSKMRDGTSCIDALYSAGCARAVFPRRTDAVEAIVVNTSGGLTGGDSFDVDARAGRGSRLVITTQAAERAYRSTSGQARVRTKIAVEAEATMCWLPQELLIFEGAALDRRLDVDLSAKAAEFLMAEPIVLGRTAMREVIHDATFLDRISVRRGGRPVYEDRLSLTGDVQALLDQTATAGGMQAMASALYVGPRAEALLQQVRALLPATGGASLLRPDILVVRLLGGDGFMLRSALCPVLEALSGAVLPRSWRL